jgi:hypothetical protein
VADCGEYRQASFLCGRWRQFHSHIVIISSNEVLTLTLAQDYREARDWFVQHRHDPFLWLVILGPLTLAAITGWWGPFVFSPSDAKRAISQVLPNTEMQNISGKTFLKCGEQTYIFGYEFISGMDFGRACRDIVNGGWVVEFHFRGRDGAETGSQIAHQR